MPDAQGNPTLQDMQAVLASLKVPVSPNDPSLPSTLGAPPAAPLSPNSFTATPQDMLRANPPPPQPSQPAPVAPAASATQLPDALGQETQANIDALRQLGSKIAGIQVPTAPTFNPTWKQRIVSGVLGGLAGATEGGGAGLETGIGVLETPYKAQQEQYNEQLARAKEQAAQYGSQLQATEESAELPFKLPAAQEQEAEAKRASEQAAILAQAVPGQGGAPSAWAQQVNARRDKMLALPGLSPVQQEAIRTAAQNDIARASSGELSMEGLDEEARQLSVQGQVHNEALFQDPNTGQQIVGFIDAYGNRINASNGAPIPPSYLIVQQTVSTKPGVVGGIRQPITTTTTRQPVLPGGAPGAQPQPVAPGQQPASAAPSASSVYAPPSAGPSGTPALSQQAPYTPPALAPRPRARRAQAAKTLTQQQAAPAASAFSSLSANDQNVIRNLTPDTVEAYDRSTGATQAISNVSSINNVIGELNNPQGVTDAAALIQTMEDLISAGRQGIGGMRITQAELQQLPSAQSFIQGVEQKVLKLVNGQQIAPETRQQMTQLLVRLRNQIKATVDGQESLYDANATLGPLARYTRAQIDSLIQQGSQSQQQPVLRTPSGPAPKNTAEFLQKYGIQ